MPHLPLCLYSHAASLQSLLRVLYLTPFHSLLASLRSFAVPRLLMGSVYPRGSLISPEQLPLELIDFTKGLPSEHGLVLDLGQVLQLRQALELVRFPVIQKDFGCVKGHQ